MNESEKYDKARQRVKEKKGFYIHLSIYLIVNIVFLIVSYLDGEGLQWLYICLFWAIGLVPHYLSVFGFPGRQNVLSQDWEEREIKKELSKMDQNQTFEEDDELELRALKKQNREWDDKDFV